MNHTMNNLIFPIAVLFTAAVSITVSLFFFLFRGREDILPKLDKIPRMKIAGIILTAVVLSWCVPHINDILDPDSVFRKAVYPGFFVLWVLCSAFLDYLFARAFGVFCILLSYTLLNQIFSANIPYSAFSAAACYILGIYGIVISAKPYYFRDTLRFAVTKKYFRICFIGYHIFYAVSMISAGIFILLKNH